MHVAAWICGHLFFLISEGIFSNVQHSLNILDVGSADVNGNLKDALQASNFHHLDYNYIGLDMDADNLNVDISVKPGQYPLDWPFEKDYFDIIISSSCLEHDDFYWETFAHMVEKLKPGGLIYLSLPSVVDIHRYPVDNYRFLPDSAYALAKWANMRNKATDMNIHVLFSECIPNNDQETDIVMIFYKSDNIPTFSNIFREVYVKHYIINRLKFAKLNNILLGTKFMDKIQLEIRNKLLSIGTDNSGSAMKDLQVEAYINDKTNSVQSKFIMNDEMLITLDYVYMGWNPHCRIPYKQLQFVEPLDSMQLPYVDYTFSLGTRACQIKYTIVFNENDFDNSSYITDTWGVMIKKAHLDPKLLGTFAEATTSVLHGIKETFYIKYPDLVI